MHRGLIIFFLLVGRPLHTAQGFESKFPDFGERLAPVLAGLRNPGQRSVEIAVSGLDTAAEVMPPCARNRKS